MNSSAMWASGNWKRRLIYSLLYQAICFFIALALREIERTEREIAFSLALQEAERNLVLKRRAVPDGD